MEYSTTYKPYQAEATTTVVATESQTLAALDSLLSRLEEMKVSQDEKPWYDAIVLYLENARVNVPGMFSD